MKELRPKPNAPIYIEPLQGGVPRSLRHLVRDALGNNPAVRVAWVTQKTLPLVDEEPTLLLGILLDPVLWHGLGRRRRKLLRRILPAIESRLPVGLPLDVLVLNRSPKLYQAVAESGPPVIDHRVKL